MNATELKALQAPLKQQYKDTPETAIITLKANGRIGEGVTCSVDTGRAVAKAGLIRQLAAMAYPYVPAICCLRR